MYYFHAKYLFTCAVHIVYSLGVEHCMWCGELSTQTLFISPSPSHRSSTTHSLTPSHHAIRLILLSSAHNSPSLPLPPPSTSSSDLPSTTSGARPRPAAEGLTGAVAPSRPSPRGASQAVEGQRCGAAAAQAPGRTEHCNGCELQCCSQSSCAIRTPVAQYCTKGLCEAIE